MNRFIALIAALALFIPNTHAQALALASNAPNYGLTTTVTFPRHDKYKQAKKVMVAGFIGMGAGATLCIGGVAAVISANSISRGNSPGNQNPQNQSNDQLQKVGVALVVTGIILFVAGSGMAIGGGIAAHPPHRMSIVAPKQNEMGIAYNF